MHEKWHQSSDNVAIPYYNDTHAYVVSLRSGSQNAMPKNRVEYPVISSHSVTHAPNAVLYQSTEPYQNSPLDLPSPGPTRPPPHTPTRPQNPTLHPLTKPVAPCPRRIRIMPLESFVVVSPSTYKMEYTVPQIPEYGATSTIVGISGSDDLSALT